MCGFQNARRTGVLLESNDDARGAVRGRLQHRWLLRMIVKKGMAFLHALFLRLQKTAACSAIARGLRENLYSLALVVNASLRRQALGAIG